MRRYPCHGLGTYLYIAKVNVVTSEPTQNLPTTHSIALKDEDTNQHQLGPNRTRWSLN